jgi:hypothetical protein
MNEFFLLLYPVLLFVYLLLAARWQPKGAPRQADEPRYAHA